MNQASAPRLIMYAPFGFKIPGVKLGGAERGCRKTLEIYRERGVDVICVDKVMRTGSTAGYAFRTVANVLRLLRICRANPGVAVHFVGFYDRIINIEKGIISLIRKAGNPVIYEMRNGNLVHCFRSYDDAYRASQLKVWDMAAGLICQGQPFVDLIREQTGRTGFLYPNYIRSVSLGSTAKSAPGDAPRLIFQGRLVPNKNVDLMIRALALLRKSHSGASLHLVGGIDPEYRRKLDEVTASLGLPAGAVVFHGFKEPEEIDRLLRQSHFFIFPSANPTEGHSNSLTEAMGAGVVPLASPMGFNRWVCGDEFVVDEYTPEAYAARMEQILADGTWGELSAKVRQRVLDNFTQKIVGDRLIAYLRENSLL